MKAKLRVNPIFGWTFLALLLVDQITKGMARAALNNGDWFANTRVIGSLSPLPAPGIFELKLIYNEGIAFGLLQGMGVFMAPIAILVSLYVAWYSRTLPAKPTLPHVALGLIASGAIGNMIDRIWLGRVTDMFWFRAIDFPVFNIADACITVGTALFFIATVWVVTHPEKPASTPENPPENTPEPEPTQPEPAPERPEQHNA